MSAATPKPDLSREQALLARCRLVAGIDEVGRGALAGPVCVGAVACDATTGEPPAGLADSKQLTPARREALVGPIRRWAAAYALGWASAAQVDALGLTAALRAAGLAALAGLPRTPAMVILDGRDDWLTSASDLFSADAELPPYKVVTVVKGDAKCATVAAASVLAKVARDAHMAELAAEHPGYGWEANKGYGSAGHMAAITRLGPSGQHRTTWALPRAAAAET